MEIERKFLLNKIPENLESYTKFDLEQAYISTEPVIRVRKKGTASNTRYILTVKSTGLMSRQEFELDIDEHSYNNLLKKSEGNIISKSRYVIPLDTSLTLELDIFHGKFEGLVMGEIEFPDEETAKKYTSPEYLSEEVTFDTRFHNSTMSNMSDTDRLDLISWIQKNNCLCNKMH